MRLGYKFLCEAVADGMAPPDAMIRFNCTYLAFIKTRARLIRQKKITKDSIDHSWNPDRVLSDLHRREEEAKQRGDSFTVSRCLKAIQTTENYRLKIRRLNEERKKKERKSDRRFLKSKRLNLDEIEPIHPCIETLRGGDLERFLKIRAQKERARLEQNDFRLVDESDDGGEDY